MSDRIEVNIESYHEGTPARSDKLGLSQFLDLAGITSERLDVFLDLGWIAPTRTGGNEPLFRVGDVYRLRKLERLCADFDLTDIGATIIVDLLERVECLERKVRDLERMLHGI